MSGRAASVPVSFAGTDDLLITAILPKHLAAALAQLVGAGSAGLSVPSWARGHWRRHVEELARVGIIVIDLEDRLRLESLVTSVGGFHA